MKTILLILLTALLSLTSGYYIGLFINDTPLMRTEYVEKEVIKDNCNYFSTAEAVEAYFFDIKCPKIATYTLDIYLEPEILPEEYGKNFINKLESMQP